MVIIIYDCNKKHTLFFEIECVFYYFNLHYYFSNFFGINFSYFAFFFNGQCCGSTCSFTNTHTNRHCSEIRMSNMCTTLKSFNKRLIIKILSLILLVVAHHKEQVIRSLNHVHFAFLGRQ